VARFLLDTNTCIYIRQRRPAVTMAHFNALMPGDAVLSVISYGELARGVERSANPDFYRKGLDELLRLIPALPLPATAGPAYGALRSALERRGEIIGNNDLWIAAHALASNLTLVTNNEREFSRIPALRIENWTR
jgi:tRNA(fMet)-specific endonuclease VapC